MKKLPDGIVGSVPRVSAGHSPEAQGLYDRAEKMIRELKKRRESALMVARRLGHEIPELQVQWERILRETE